MTSIDEDCALRKILGLKLKDAFVFDADELSKRILPFLCTWDEKRAPMMEMLHPINNSDLCTPAMINNKLFSIAQVLRIWVDDYDKTKSGGSVTHENALACRQAIINAIVQADRTASAQSKQRAGIHGGNDPVTTMRQRRINQLFHILQSSGRNPTTVVAEGYDQELQDLAQLIEQEIYNHCVERAKEVFPDAAQGINWKMPILASTYQDRMATVEAAIDKDSDQSKEFGCKLELLREKGPREFIRMTERELYPDAGKDTTESIERRANVKSTADVDKSIVCPQCHKRDSKREERRYRNLDEATAQQAKCNNCGYVWIIG